MKKLTYFLIMIFGFSLSARADLFRVEVPVAVEADSAVIAKEKAFNEAADKAFTLLMERLVLSGDAAAVAASPEERARLVQGFSVAGEKTTPTKYMANVSVQFKPKEVQEFMKEKGLIFSAKMPPKFVFVPLFRDGSLAQVFDETNPLFQSVKTTSPSTSIHQFVVPTGDLEDMAIATPMVLMGSDMSALNPLMQKYGVSEALVMRVSKNGNIYKVETVAYPAVESSGANVVFAVSSSSTDMQGIMAQIVKKATTEMEKKWKAYQSKSGGKQSELVVILPINGLSEWTVLEKRLKGLPFLDTMTVQALHQNKVFVKIVSGEEIETIVNKMGAAGFLLRQENNNTWIWEKEEVPMSSNVAVQAGTPIVNVDGGIF